MAKDQNQQKQMNAEQQFPSQILYSSPPEAASLNAWVKKIDGRQSKEDFSQQG